MPTLTNLMLERSTLLHDLVNIVDVRDSPAVSFPAASDGQVGAEQGSVGTGNSSNVWVDFSGGGMVGLAENTSVAIIQLGGRDIAQASMPDLLAHRALVRRFVVAGVSRDSNKIRQRLLGQW